MTDDEFKKQLQAKREERRKAAEERDMAANEAIKRALVAVDFDEAKVVVHRLPPEHGGAVVYSLPGVEFWAAYMRRLVASEKRGNLPEVTAGLVENKDLLLHPKLSELQAWQEANPGLYTSIANTIGTRCDGLDPGKG